VRFGDLDLTRAAGAQELYRRITHAARDVCETIGPGGSAVGIRNRACIDRAIARAVVDIDSPLLTERYERQTRRRILPLQQASRRPGAAALARSGHLAASHNPGNVQSAAVLKVR
jgi:hypothetical protein